jgi:hypothetical protein
MKLNQVSPSPFIAPTNHIFRNRMSSTFYLPSHPCDRRLKISVAREGVDCLRTYAIAPLATQIWVELDLLPQGWREGGQNDGICVSSMRVELTEVVVLYTRKCDRSSFCEVIYASNSVLGDHINSLAGYC